MKHLALALLGALVLGIASPAEQSPAPTFKDISKLVPDQCVAEQVLGNCQTATLATIAARV